MFYAKCYNFNHMAIKKIIQSGHPGLKTKNKKVKTVNSPEIQKIIKDLENTLYKTGLIGIAANQINENYMIFITHPRTTNARKLGKKDKLRIFINPDYKFKSKHESIIYEGCGSIGKIFGPVKRPSEIEIQAIDIKGNKFSLKCNGILARVIQHEMDHLNGIEFIEKVYDYSKIISYEFYRKNIRNSDEQIKNSQVTLIEYKLIKN